MPSAAFAAELARFGPQAAGTERVDLDAARQYCRSLAARHYENFTVASWLLPRRLRPHFHAIYAYCRWADDLADETGDPAEALRLLDWWEQQLHLCYQGRAEHPVFVALAETVRQFDIPVDPLADLLTAFRQDQQPARYETFDELLGYCRNSANPVGRLVLYLGQCHTAENVALADRICTGLQLANFIQDVARDWDERGRIYLPLEDARRAGYDEVCIARRETSDAFRRWMAAEVERADAFLTSGLPLVERVPRALRIDVWLFIHGGLAVLEAIRRVDYDLWRRRPTVAKRAKLRLLWRGWWAARGGAD